MSSDKYSCRFQPNISFLQNRQRNMKTFKFLLWEELFYYLLSLCNWSAWNLNYLKNYNTQRQDSIFYVNLSRFFTFGRTYFHRTSYTPHYDIITWLSGRTARIHTYQMSNRENRELVSLIAEARRAPAPLEGALPRLYVSVYVKFGGLYIGHVTNPALLNQLIKCSTYPLVRPVGSLL